MINKCIHALFQQNLASHSYNSAHTLTPGSCLSLYNVSLLLLAAEQAGPLESLAQGHLGCSYGRRRACCMSKWIIEFTFKKLFPMYGGALGRKSAGKQQLTWPQPSVHFEVLFLLLWHDGTPRSEINTEKKVYASLIFSPYSCSVLRSMSLAVIHLYFFLSSSLVPFALLLCTSAFLKNLW